MGWVFTALKIWLQGSSHWQAIWTAWATVRKELTKALANMHAKKMHYHLFLITEITTDDNVSLGTEANTRFRTWSINGVNRVEDILEGHRHN